MNFFPIFMKMQGQRIVVSGGGETAVAKLRLLLKTTAQIDVFCSDASDTVKDWAMQGKITLYPRAFAAGDAINAQLFYAADEDPDVAMQAATIARTDGVTANVVDNLEHSDFITAAMVDRDPVTIAIGTEGAAPVLARDIKKRLEEQLPPTLGQLARIGKAFRDRAMKLPQGMARRKFWSEYYFDAGPDLLDAAPAAVEERLETLLQKHLNHTPDEGHVTFVGAGPGDPELLTLKARKALHEADVVIYDGLVAAPILELCRREAEMLAVGKTGFAPSTPQAEINALLVEHASTGAQVVRLKGGDPTVFGRLDEEIDALEPAGISWGIVPGITAASATVAALGQSLTKRGRNQEVRLMTAHDVDGFADQDWSAIADPDAVTAVYMGKRAARFIQGRLMMHGASASLPVSIVENASRPDQRILATTLGQMAEDLRAADMTGPALTVIGLAPREAAQRHILEGLAL